MDIKEYIASGILESYALGFASEQERREVECMSAIYPELKEELVNIQASFESYAKSIAVEPPAELKASILESIKGIDQDEKIVPMKKIDSDKGGNSNNNVRQLSPNYWKVGVAASVAVIIGLGLMYRSVATNNNELNDRITAMETSTQDRVNALKDSLNETSLRQQFILDNNTEQVILAGTDVSPNSKARVFWNKEKSSFIFVQDDLPTPVSGKQYQLWAISDGTPVDLGVLDDSVNMTDPKGLDISSIQAFAITLEKEGGSPEPTLDQMYVLGTTKS